METANGIFLSTTPIEKFTLFKDLKRLKINELPVEDQLLYLQHPHDDITEINLKQAAIRIGRNYSGIYNSYMGILDDFRFMLAVKQPSVKEIFKVSEDAYHWFLVQRSLPYQLLDALFNHKEPDMKTLLADLGISKATLIRHLKGFRELIRQLNVRITYSPLSIRGNEKSIRLVYLLLFWSATNGYVWPFQNMTQQDALSMFRAIRNDAQMDTVNRVAEEMGAYLIAISYSRITENKIIVEQPQDTMLDNDYPNAFRQFDDLDLGGRLTHANLTEREEMAETNTFYFLYHFSPIFLSSDDAFIQISNQRYKRHNPMIWDFVTNFIINLPIDLRHELLMDREQIEMLRANMLSITLSTYIFKGDINRFMALRYYDLPDTVTGDQYLYDTIRATTRSLLMDPKYKVLQAVGLDLVKTFYELFRHVATQYDEETKIVIGLSLEQSYLAYVDLLQFLKHIPFVSIMRPTDSPKVIDFYITTSSNWIADDLRVDCAIYNWQVEGHVEQFGQLYSLLRQLWINKNKAHADAVKLFISEDDHLDYSGDSK